LFAQGRSPDRTQISNVPRFSTRKALHHTPINILIHLFPFPSSPDPSFHVEHTFSSIFTHGRQAVACWPIPQPAHFPDFTNTTASSCTTVYANFRLTSASIPSSFEIQSLVVRLWTFMTTSTESTLCSGSWPALLRPLGAIVYAAAQLEHSGQLAPIFLLISPTPSRHSPQTLRISLSRSTIGLRTLFSISPYGPWVIIPSTLVIPFRTLGVTSWTLSDKDRST